MLDPGGGSRFPYDIIAKMEERPALPAPGWVETPAQLEVLCDALRRCERVAVDTESNSLHAYREQVCLIQFSTQTTDFLLDPLALPDLDPLSPILANASIEKVFHAAEYDLICLARDFAFRVESLFDTMHAARVLGYPAVGLDSLLTDKFGVSLNKRYQKADWAARPLSPEQIDYARQDTHYLLRLRDVLWAELVQKDRQTLALEDFRRMSHVDPPRERTSDDAIRRFAGRKDLTPREITVLNELCQWREGKAEQLDRPVYKVMTDEMLVAVAHALPAQGVDLAGIGVSVRQIQLWGEEVLDAVKRGLALPLARAEVRRSRDEAMLARLERLKRWRKNVAAASGVESDIVLPRSYLLALAQRPPRSASELADLMAGSPTRVQEFGTEILQVLGG